MILITGAYNVRPEGATEFVVQNLPAMTDPNSPAFTQLAVESVMPAIGKPFVALALTINAAVMAVRLTASRHSYALSITSRTSSSWTS